MKRLVLGLALVCVLAPSANAQPRWQGWHRAPEWDRGIYWHPHPHYYPRPDANPLGAFLGGMLGGFLAGKLQENDDADARK